MSRGSLKYFRLALFSPQNQSQLLKTVESRGPEDFKGYAQDLLQYAQNLKWLGAHAKHLLEV